MDARFAAAGRRALRAVVGEGRSGRAPTIVRRVLTMGWRHVLGLALGPRDAGHVLGWTLVRNVADEIEICASSPVLHAANSVTVKPDVLVWTTDVRYARRLGRALWSLAAPVHRVTLPLLLRRARRRA